MSFKGWTMSNIKATGPHKRTTASVNHPNVAFCIPSQMCEAALSRLSPLHFVSGSPSLNGYQESVSQRATLPA